MNNGSQSSEFVTDRPALEHACKLRWENPGMIWADVAANVGISERQLHRWRNTEQWEIAFRKVGADYIDKLAPSAVEALLRAWEKGNPAGALDVLRSFGFLRPERIEVEHSERSADIDRRWDKVMADLGLSTDET